MTFPCIFVTLLLKGDPQKTPAQDAANMARFIRCRFLRDTVLVYESGTQPDGSVFLVLSWQDAPQIHLSEQRTVSL